jgi:hypothetical protein
VGRVRARPLAPDGGGRGGLGHSGYAPGVHTELWHLPQRGLTLFTVSNDDLIGAADHQRALLRVALEKL